MVRKNAERTAVCHQVPRVISWTISQALWCLRFCCLPFRRRALLLTLTKLNRGWLWRMPHDAQGKNHNKHLFPSQRPWPINSTTYTSHSSTHPKPLIFYRYLHCTKQSIRLGFFFFPSKKQNIFCPKKVHACCCCKQCLCCRRKDSKMMSLFTSQLMQNVCFATLAVSFMRTTVWMVFILSYWKHTAPENTFIVLSRRGKRNRSSIIDIM